jgi:zinc protease
MRFGPELNAYTSFDETVYMLEVPTDTTEMVEKGFQILEDWAHLLTFDEEEIDKERGVIGEEWRLGRGADARMLDKQLPVLFKDSRYAERLTIGKKAVIDTCHYDTLRKFYRDWYRPDLMAVVAVGDFDPAWISGLVTDHFSDIPSPVEPRERKIYPVPDHQETLTSVATDPEAAYTTAAVIFMSAPSKDVTIGDYRRRLVESIHDDMLSDRLVELTKKADPPFLFAISAEVPLARSKRLQMIAALVNQGGIERGVETLLYETARANRYGFTDTELERSKRELARDAESAYAERDKTESKALAMECLNHFLRGAALPGVEAEYKLTEELLPGITLDEVDSLAADRVAETNRVVLVNAPEKEGVAVPTEDDLAEIYTRVKQTAVEPYVDLASEAPLVASEPQPAEIVRESASAELGLTEWTLSNGVRVVLKPTDFKNDEIVFYGYSTGGNSLASDASFVSAETAPDLIAESGVGDFNSVELEKMLSGKVVDVSPFIDAMTEGISGSASPQDMDSMFKLIYLYVTSPRRDQEAFESLRAKMQGFVENRSASPDAAFIDTLQVTLAQHHLRSRPWSTELVKEMNMAAAYDFYNDRFADADDFTFYFVGNFTIDGIRPLVASYLGALPATDREETWRDLGMVPPKGVVKKTVRRGIEEKGQVGIVFTGPFEWSPESEHALKSLASVMEIELREVLREDLGGTYGVSIQAEAGPYPRPEYGLWIIFGCDPHRAEELTETVFDRIDGLRTRGPDKDYVDRVKESQNRGHEVDLRDNEYWLRELRTSGFEGTDPSLILRYPQLVERLSVDLMRETAAKYLNTDNYVQVVLLPEGE